MEANLVGVGGQLDAPRLSSTADLDLGLDDDRIPGGVGRGHRFLHGVGHTPGGYGDSVAGEVLLALVLEEIHPRS